MKPKYINIIALNLPNPPDYGGVIDIYYRIKTLHEQGVKIILHAFVYGRNDLGKLEDYCEKIILYKRKTNIFSFLNFTPYIIKSRGIKELLHNITKNDYPIFFDGLHTCYYLNNKLLANRNKIVRVHNVEHEYYYNLYQTEKNILKKLFFYTECKKLKKYEKILMHATSILSVAQQDNQHFAKYYPSVNNKLVPSFHPYDICETTIGTGKYALFHGNLSVHENIVAAEFLINKIFNNIDFPLIIAGKNPPEKMKINCKNKKNITLIESPSEEKMKALISNAHIHTLYTEQPTGLKLKLLYSLFNGRHILVNDKMLTGTDLHNCCNIANTENEWISMIPKLFAQDFTAIELNKRQQYLKLYDNKTNAQQIIDLCQ